jgi:phosphate transport system substrate-binding protein
MRPLVIGVIILAVGLISGCGSATRNDASGSGEKSSISIDGSSTVYPISARMMELYDKEHKGTKITVNLSGTGGGMKKFSGGQIDICDSSRRIRPSEVEACNDGGVEFVEFAIAYDGLAIVVSKNNTWCDSLTIDQLKKLWTPDGPARTWREIDPSWPEKEVVLYGPGTDSGTFDYFTEKVVGKVKSIRSDFSPSEDDNVIVTGVSTNKFALGYVGFAYYEQNRGKLKLLAVDSGAGTQLKPSFETVSKNTYPLTRPLFLYVRKASLDNPAKAEFVRFYLDNAGAAAKTVGYVPIKAEIQKANLELFAGATQ